MQAARPPFLRGILLLAALAAIAIIMARGESPAQATTYNPAFDVSVSDPTPGAAADIMIDFSLEEPDSFPNVRTNSTIQFIPRQWGVNPAPVGAIGGTFNALSTLGTLGFEPCYFPIPVPFTMIEATTDTTHLASALDVGAGLGPEGSDLHPGGAGYSGQFVDDPATRQTPGDLNQRLINFNYGVPGILNEMRSAQANSQGQPMEDGEEVYRDMDGDGYISVGDVRLTAWHNATGVIPGSDAYLTYLAGSVVQAGDGDLSFDLNSDGLPTRGISLTRLLANEKHVDPNNNGQMDPDEQGIYRDVDGSGTVTYGDIRLFHTNEMPFGTVVQDFKLPGGISRYPDFLNQMFPPSDVGEPLARQFGETNVLNITAVSLNIVTYRPGQLPGYPATLGYPNIVVLLDPVAPIEMASINTTSDLCAPLSLTSTNLGISQDNPATLANEGGYVRLTNPKSEKDHTFTLITTSQPDADNDNIENMLDTCPLNPNITDLDGRSPAGRGPDRDALDNACDPDPVNRSPMNAWFKPDQDQDNYSNRADNCTLAPNGRELFDIGYVMVNAFVFYYGVTGDLIGPDDQADTDGDDIGDACEGAEAGTQTQCANNVDDDGDGVVNDGCPTNPSEPSPTPESGAQCDNAVDDDFDGFVNDGCPDYPGFGQWEDAAQCQNAIDDDGDGKVNDGCMARSRVGAPETGDQCNNATDDDGDGLVNDGCPVLDPGDVAKTTITGHMHVVTLTNSVPIFKHGVKLNQLGGPKKVSDGGARTYSVDISNLGSSAEDVRVGLRVVEGCAAVSGPSSVSVAAGGSATASFTVDFTGCAAGTYTVQADACHAGDAAPAGLFGSGACPGASDGMADPNPLDDAPIAKSVEVGSP